MSTETPTSENWQSATWSLQEQLQDYRCAETLLEIVYRDEAGQIQTVHDVVRDLFVRAGQEFLILGRGQLVRFDHLLVLDGRVINQA
ncbi:MULTISPECIES: hypothetical protein [Marinobacter]|uniref:hypothetical protein n=1 Tax=Marinobacter TaxID=2742 RepID=UPI001D1754DF|nr:MULTISPECIES: hypothetical protein [Marinobacter]